MSKKGIHQTGRPEAIEGSMTECKWEGKSPSSYSDEYETSCDQLFQFDRGGTPKDNEFKYCPLCGGKLIDITEDTSNRKT